MKLFLSVFLLSFSFFLFSCGDKKANQSAYQNRLEPLKFKRGLEGPLLEKNNEIARGEYQLRAFYCVPDKVSKNEGKLIKPKNENDPLIKTASNFIGGTLIISPRGDMDIFLRVETYEGAQISTPAKFECDYYRHAKTMDYQLMTLDLSPIPEKIKCIQKDGGLYNGNELKDFLISWGSVKNFSYFTFPLGKDEKPKYLALSLKEDFMYLKSGMCSTQKGEFGAEEGDSAYYLFERVK